MKCLVIGLDCAAPQLVFEQWREELPTLRGLMSRARMVGWRAHIHRSLSQLGPR